MVGSDPRRPRPPTRTTEVAPAIKGSHARYPSISVGHTACAFHAHARRATKAPAQCVARAAAAGNATPWPIRVAQASAPVTSGYRGPVDELSGATLNGRTVWGPGKRQPKWPWAISSVE